MRRWRFAGTVVVSSALSVAGCATTQHFDAAERATAVSPRGDLAAEYEVTGASGQIAETKVWLRGAYASQVGEREVTVVEVVFEVENEGTGPVELAALRLHTIEVGGVRFQELVPFRVEGHRLLQPGEEARIEAFWALPDRFDPDDISRLEVGWVLHHAGGEYAQRTPFRHAPERYATAYPHYYGYYGPFVYDPYFGPLGPPGGYVWRP
jgi:hypothetical protein